MNEQGKISRRKNVNLKTTKQLKLTFLVFFRQHTSSINGPVRNQVCKYYTFAFKFFFQQKTTGAAAKLIIRIESRNACFIISLNLSNYHYYYDNTSLVTFSFLFLCSWTTQHIHSMLLNQKANYCRRLCSSTFIIFLLPYKLLD